MSERLSAWQAAVAPREFTLSNGLAVLLRPVSLLNLVVAGTVPVTVLQEMDKARQRKHAPQDVAATVRMAAAIDAVVMAAVADPPITREGGPDSIPLDAIDFNDRVAIFQEVNRPAAAFGNFREQPDGDDAAAPDGQDLRPEAERAGGDSG